MSFDPAADRESMTGHSCTSIVLCSPAECIQGGLRSSLAGAKPRRIGVYEFDEQARDVQCR